MKLRLFIAAAAVTALSACATVDLADVTSSGASAKTTVVERNVVQRAAAKLYAAFTTKGWSTQNSKKRVQSAASVLLKGLEQTDIKSGTSYAKQNKSVSIVLADMRAATQYVNQTTKAAEVYLAMAPVGVSLREELSSLEKALLITRQAESVFGTALGENHPHAAEVAQFTRSVDALRDVTDACGVRVREEHTRLPESSI